MKKFIAKTMFKNSVIFGDKIFQRQKNFFIFYFAIFGDGIIHRQK